MSVQTSPLTREPTAWTRPLQLIVAVGSVLTTIGTAIVLGYVTPEAIAWAFPGRTIDELAGGLTGFHVSGVIFLIANTVGILALWNKAWVFYFVLVLDLAQGIGFLTFDREAAGLRGLGVFASVLTDGGGGLLGLVMLGFLLRYRTAWAWRRVERH